MEEKTRKEFIDSFADVWQKRGIPRMQGQIMAYLLLDETQRVTAGELSEELDISRGSVSMHIRALIRARMVHMTRHEGERSHFYSAGEDVWADFLVREQEFLQAQQKIATRMLDALPHDAPAARRVRNMEHYMRWAVSLDLPARWRQEVGLDR